MTALDRLDPGPPVFRVTVDPVALSLASEAIREAWEGLVPAFVEMGRVMATLYPMMREMSEQLAARERARLRR